jgi:hypothetical protein
MEQDVDNSIDEGYAEISDATEWFETYDTITKPEGIFVFDIRQCTTYEFLAPGPAFNPTTNRWLTYEVPRTFDISDRLWEKRLAEPEYIMVRGIWWIIYWPLNARPIKQYYTAIPGVISALAEPGFPEQFHQGLVEYALFDLWAQDAETDLAWASWKEYLKYEEGLGEFVGNRAGVPRVNASRPSTND